MNLTLTISGKESFNFLSYQPVLDFGELTLKHLDKSIVSSGTNAQEQLESDILDYATERLALMIDDVTLALNPTVEIGYIYAQSYHFRSNIRFDVIVSWDVPASAFSPTNLPFDAPTLTTVSFLDNEPNTREK